MQKKFIFRIVVILLIIIGFVWWFLYELTWEGGRDIGVLSHPCNTEYSIKITQYSKFDWAQPLYFEILKKDKSLKDCYSQFGITNNTSENINNFEIHCYDNILYVTWKDENIPIIMLDTKTLKSYPNKYIKDSYEDDKFKNELFDRIKKGNQKLEID